MAVSKLSVALDPAVAKGAAEAARRRGVSLSAWINEAAERALVIERGLTDIAYWEAEHGALTPDELAWADQQLSGAAARRG